MKSHEKRARAVRAVPFGLLVAASVLGLLLSPEAWAGQRQFLVILANSPKQYPNPSRNPAGQPAGGLTSKEFVRRQYFDNDIGSFAEYWKEISYGDVTITGDVTDWIDLPWAIQPPLVDATRDNAAGNPPVGDDLGSAAVRNSPVNFFDANQSGFYEYGSPEYFSTRFAASIIDLSGFAGGPRFAGPGSGHRTAVNAFPVWKPGERFIDMNDDGDWDGLDEANNRMDFFGGPNGGPDGRPDSLGPWIDLNLDGVPENEGDCIYLTDSDNDGNPDCCPDGPGPTGCDRYPAVGACPPTTWTIVINNFEFIDCNGNLIPDVFDILAGTSKDRSALNVVGQGCATGAGDGIPDECQIANAETDCVVAPPTAADDPCRGKPVCVPLPNGLRDPIKRCEFFDANLSDDITLVEPFENFMRRWDPCLFDPDVSPPNAAPPNPATHWIKVYDPHSPNATVALTCESPSYTVRYDDPSYIRDNYPARDADQDELIAETSDRAIYEQHDPDGKLGGAPCKCRIPWPDDGSRVCRDVTLPDSYCRVPPCIIRKACIAGHHSQFDPPDFWANVKTTNGPDNSEVATTKMRALAGGGGQAGFILQQTPEPSAYVQAWEDRYGAQCENPSYRDDAPVGPNNQPTVLCTAPPWTKDAGGRGRTYQMVPFDDVVTETYNPAVNRRFFKANRGGLWGDGTGWVDCDPNNDPAIVFETGPISNVRRVGFEVACNHRILPEEFTGGVSQPGEFFDGWVEHDDLPSSKYHSAGDQRLGEVTSPYSNDIWGQDRGPNEPNSTPIVDNIIPAAGPYATHVHGNNGYDAGNLLLMELLTWRTRPPFNNAKVWQATTAGAADHPYAYRENKGFRDYNLDGLVDQGECRPAGSENYQVDSLAATPNDGVSTAYPFNRQRLMEDAVAMVDDLLDFDDFEDVVSLERVTCPGPPILSACLLPQLRGRGAAPAVCDPVNANGLISGIVLLPPGAFAFGDFNLAPSFHPIHNADTNDKRCGAGSRINEACALSRCDAGPHKSRECLAPADCPSGACAAVAECPNGACVPTNLFPKDRDATFEKINWDVFFHDLVSSLDVSGERVVPTANFQTAFAAHEYLHAWEGFPDLYDYDVSAPPPQPVINCPVGTWDIMAQGGLVHPVPILKEKPCTDWTEPVDLTTVVTPGVDATITLPPAEFVRDSSYLFLENDDRPGERYYFWSAGLGFDQRMPSDGMLILHTDVGSNPDALPPFQFNGTRFTYLIVQSDGLHELEAGRVVDPVCGDEGDVWPGSANKRRFNFSTNPPATWYTQNAWTGLDVLDVRPDEFGSVQLKLNWVPTSVPTLKFVDPPGGESVGNPPNANYNVRAEANDVYGGTWIRFFYTTDAAATPNPATGKLIQLVRKTTPGNHALSVNWKLCTQVGENCVALPDGRYFLFADLIPDRGADGTERKFSTPRAGRNNQGTATLQVLSADVLTSTIQNGQVTSDGKARSETWTLRCVNPTTGEWVVNSSLTHPAPAPGTPPPDPSPRALAGQKFTSAAGGVSFTIQTGGALGDTFTFTTTGITALSEAVTLRGGQIKEGPTAVIDASPLAGPPPLTVSFDARGSIDPNGQPLQFRWIWGDGSPTETGAQKTHTFTLAGTFTVVLRATNPANGRFGEASVDISVTNNSPKAVIRATPVSGQGPLTVKFSGTQSSDLETPADQLIYQWTYGDGGSANDAGLAGADFREVEHTYSKREDGASCTTANPCTFTATLKVTDGGGKSDTASTVIRVGNTNPVANVSTTALQGSSPLTVTFNAKNSTDADKTCNGIGPVCTQNTDCPSGQVCKSDPLEVEWQWGDGTPNEKYPAKTGKPPATDGSVPHTFTLPAGTTSKTFAVKATVYDLKADGARKGGETIWPGVSVTVVTAVAGDSDPRAIFCFQVGNECKTTTTLAVDGSFTVDAGRSFDNPTGGRISAYTWDWGDGTPFASGVTQTHKYSAAGTYTITLTVADGDSPPHTGRTQKSVVVTKEGGEPPPPSTNHPPSAIFVISPPEAFVGGVVNFDARSSSDPDGDALRYRWVFGDGNQTQFTTNPRMTHTYASPASYLVRLTVRDAANASTDATQTVRVLLQGENRSPVAMIATGPRAGTAPLTLTFDGRISYDPDGTAITYSWEFRQNGELMDTMTGSVVTRVFATPGDYTVELVVKDGAGAGGRSEPQSILVTESSAPPPPEPPPPRPEPQEPPDSSGQRPAPTTMCGLGMLPGLLASLAGLTLTAMTRRRLKG